MVNDLPKRILGHKSATDVDEMLQALTRSEEEHVPGLEESQHLRLRKVRWGLSADRKHPPLGQVDLLLGVKERRLSVGREIYGCGQHLSA